MKAEPQDAGCWIDGHWGWRGSHRLVEIAHEYGWPGDTSPIPDDYEFIHEIADEAEFWMNENVAPEGYSFVWHDGEFFLWSDEEIEETGW